MNNILLFNVLLIDILRSGISNILIQLFQNILWLLFFSCSSFRFRLFINVCILILFRLNFFRLIFFRLSLFSLNIFNFINLTLNVIIFISLTFLIILHFLFLCFSSSCFSSCLSFSCLFFSFWTNNRRRWILVNLPINGVIL